MAKTKIKVTMYEQRYGNDIITEDEYQAMFKERVEEIDNDEYSFKEWLDDEFRASDVLGKSETEFRDLFHKANVEYVEEEFTNDWVEIEKEITVDLSKVKEVETDCRCPYCGKK